MKPGRQPARSPSKGGDGALPHETAPTPRRVHARSRPEAEHMRTPTTFRHPRKGLDMFHPKFLFAPVAAAVLAACAVGPNYHAPETPSPERFGAAQVATYSTDPAAANPARFW